MVNTKRHVHGFVDIAPTSVDQDSVFLHTECAGV
jgi:hypothetical protein